MEKENILNRLSILNDTYPLLHLNIDPNSSIEQLSSIYQTAYQTILYEEHDKRRRHALICTFMALEFIFARINDYRRVVDLLPMNPTSIQLMMIYDQWNNDLHIAINNGSFTSDDREIINLTDQIKTLYS